ncbi:MAG: flavodoxin [Eubacteriales bacterium]|nr:flavodoxin [Eubacteriales bacterium]
MKKILSIILTLVLAFSLAACGTGNTQPEETANPPQSDENTSTDNEATDDSKTEESESTADAASAQGKVLVAYFSKTGNTETIANMIAGQTGGELFKVETVTPYPEDYDETVDIAREEQDNDARPELSTHVEDMSQYDVIYLGYPNWWGTMPQAMFTFLEEYDFSGKTIIPFCTHGGSALGRSEGDIASLVPDALLLDGLAVSGSSVDGAQADVEEWLNGLGLE